MIKRMNKKGQNFTSTELVGLLLVLGVAAVLIIGFTQGFGFFTKFFKKSNVDIAFMSEKCNGLLNQGSSSGFCNDIIEISSNNYVNCRYAIDTLGASVDATLQSTLNSLLCADASQKICNKLKLEQGDKFNADKVKVNDKTCNSITLEIVG